MADDALQYPQYTDHSGSNYSVIGGDFSTRKRTVTQKLGVHLYSLNPLLPDPQTFAQSFLDESPIGTLGNTINYWPRVDVYAPQESIEACIEHHRREKIFREDAKQEMRRQVVSAAANEEEAEIALRNIRGREPLPHIVPTWCESAALVGKRRWGPDNHYRSFIFIVPEECRVWESVMKRGIWMARFDQDVTLDMQISMEVRRCWDASDLPKLRDGEGWVWVDVEDYGPAVNVERLAIDCGDRIEWDGAGCSPGEIPSSVYTEWMSLTEVLNDCTYRTIGCEMCDEDEPHAECEWELDEHYFNQDGQCIDCTREINQRRRDSAVVG